MYCIIKCIVQGKQARVKNADLRHPSCTVVGEKRKSASPVLNVLRSVMKINMRHINVILLHFTCSVLYVTKEPNVTTLHMNTVKYAAPVEMQKSIKKVEQGDGTP